MDFYETDLIAPLKMKKYKVHMKLVITSNILQLAFSVLDTMDGPKMVYKSFLRKEWRDPVWPIQNISVKPASGNTLNLISKIIQPFRLRDLHVVSSSTL